MPISVMTSLSKKLTHKIEKKYICMLHFNSLKRSLLKMCVENPKHKSEMIRWGYVHVPGVVLDGTERVAHFKRNFKCTKYVETVWFSKEMQSNRTITTTAENNNNNKQKTTTQAESAAIKSKAKTKL